METISLFEKHDTGYLNLQNTINKHSIHDFENKAPILDSSVYIQQVINQYNKVATIFDTFPIAAKYDVQLFVDRIPKNDRVTALDIGCGTGRTVYELSQHFNKVVGIDLSDSMIDFANLKCTFKPNTKFINEDIRRITFKPNSFDYIVSHTTFHHLDKDLIATLEMVKESLKPNGKIVIIDILAKGLMKSNASIVRKIVASLTFLKDFPNIGLINAKKNYQKATHPAWMNHLKMDKFLSKRDFIEKFCSVFPNATFNEFKMEYGLNHLILFEWTKQ